MWMVILSAAVTFVSTEIDDLLLLFILFSRAGTVKEKIAVSLGKFAGLSVLTIACACFSNMLCKIPSKYIGFLGLIPVAIGVKELVEKLKGEKENQQLVEKINGMEKSDQEKSFRQLAYIFAVTLLITFAAGGDNIAVYISYFTSVHGWQYAAVAVVFAVLQAVCCVVAALVNELPVVQKVTEKAGVFVMPVLFLLLGVYIMFENGTFQWLFSLMNK